MQYFMYYTIKSQLGSKINTWHVPNVSNWTKNLVRMIVCPLADVSDMRDSNQKHPQKKTSVATHASSNNLPWWKVYW